MAGHVIGDEGGGDAVLLQFPNGEARALQERAGFVGENVHGLAGFDGGADHAESGAVPGGSQRAGVAMGEHGAPVRHQRRAVAADGAVDGDILRAHQNRLLDEPPPHGIERQPRTPA